MFRKDFYEFQGGAGWGKASAFFLRFGKRAFEKLNIIPKPKGIPSTTATAPAYPE